MLAPPAIDGLGISSGFQMQIELLDGSNDFRKLGDATQALIRAARADPRIQFAFTSLRTSAPQVRLRLDPRPRREPRRLGERRL